MESENVKFKNDDKGLLETSLDVDRYHSSNEFELQDKGAEVACIKDNPHSKMSRVGKVRCLVMDIIERVSEEGKMFTSIEQFIEVLKEYRVANEFQIQQEHNNNNRFRASCKVDGYS